MELDDTQRSAVEGCLDLSKRIFAVSGPAGSGKTTIIRMAYDALRKERKRVALCAPTGKAARRIKEATGIDAHTIHKLLEYPRPGERDVATGKPLDPGVPKRDRKNPLEFDVVIADEYAMVNHELNRNLLDALPPGGCLRVFGDLHQLPPIEDYKLRTAHGGASPFEQHVQRKAVQLDRVYRQAEGSGILIGANNIRKGIMFRRTDDLTCTITTRPVDTLYEYVLTALDEGVSYGNLENQIISPSKQTRWISCEKLNPPLRDIFNGSPAKVVDLPRHKWEEKRGPLRIGLGDKIVCTENTYDMRDFEERFAEWGPNGKPYLHSYIPTPPNKQMLNGETGLVIDIRYDGSLEVDFGDRVVEIPKQYWEYAVKRDDYIPVDPRRSIDLAYVLTTHKCQGSEYERIIYLMNKSSMFQQGRENFYTGVTRAKKVAHIITDQESLNAALKYKVRRT